MARTTPRPRPTQEQTLETLYPDCVSCGRLMWVAYENGRTVTTLDAVVRLALPVRRCETPGCDRYHVAYRPEAEGRWALPKHEFGLDVIAWIGALRYGEHRSVPEIHRRLRERGVAIAERTVEHLLARYEELVGLRWSDRSRLQAVLAQQGRLIVALDGLQPDKGQEVLWVVREVLSREVLGAQSVLSSNQAALEAVLTQALAGLDVPVVGVISDGEAALRNAVAAVLPDVPHQLCQYHYLREATKPVWEADRHAKKALKQPVRGVRPLERQVEGRDDAEARVVQGYCAAVRSALTDDGRPPLDASGLKLRQRLTAIHASLDRVAKKGGGVRR
jgi:Transposase, Mutator family